jgi:hypothetical protein
MLVPAAPLADKHLRHLLATRALQGLEGERKSSLLLGLPGSAHSDMPIVTCAAIDSSLTVTPASAASSAVRRCESMNEGVSSGYMSDMSLSTHGTSDWPGSTRSEGSGSSLHNPYKFKHNITKRFSQEGKIPANYDGSSSASSKEELEEHVASMRHRKKHPRHISSSNSTPYPTSDMSGTTGISSPDSGEGDKERRKGAGVEGRDSGADAAQTSSLPLPGFVLHPSGTHYMPMSVSYTTLPDMFQGGGPEHGPSVFHPISIPVHFRGPVISVASTQMRPRHTTTSATAHMGRSSMTASLSQRLHAKLAKLDEGLG